MYVCMYECMCVYIYIYIYTCMYVYIYIYIYTHMSLAAGPRTAFAEVRTSLRGASLPPGSGRTIFTHLIFTYLKCVYICVYICIYTNM